MMALGKLAVLVVDDDASDRMQMRRALDASGLELQVVDVDSPAQAATLPHPPDLVFMDYMMPGTDGIQAIQTLGALWPGTAQVLVSGRGDADIVSNAFRSGVADYVPKSSISPRVLRRIVENAVSLARMRAQMEEQQGELRAFANVLAHDLKAPLRSATFLCDELEEALDRDDPADAREVSDDLQRLVGRMDALIQSLEAHIDLDAAARPFARVPTGELAAVAVDDLARSIAETGASIDIAPDMPALLCDPPQIAQLFQNLVANAIKYRGAAPPKIAISGWAEPDGAVHLVVADNGQGIAPAQFDRIFEPFTRAHGRSDVPGSGLGLATCRKIARRHNGRIWCESQPGEGAAFHLSLRPDAESAADP
ncbi:MAG: ATP-binding protein [Pseudomonadota bacterium]